MNLEKRLWKLKRKVNMDEQALYKFIKKKGFDDDLTAISYHKFRLLDDLVKVDSSGVLAYQAVENFICMLLHVYRLGGRIDSKDYLNGWCVK